MGRPACPDPHPGGDSGVEECVAFPTNGPLELPRYPDPGAHRDLKCKLNVPVGQSGVRFDGLVCECEEAFYPLPREIADVGPVEFHVV